MKREEKGLVKILFVIGTLLGGGAERVLCDMVKHLDKKKFAITVMTVNDEGIYIEEIKKHARYQTIYRTGASTREEAAQILERHAYLQGLDSDEAFSAAVIQEEYHIEVAFLTCLSTRIVAHSPHQHARKIAWVHSDLLVNNGEEELYESIQHQREVYGRFHDIVMVSQGVEAAFRQKLGQFGNHRIIPNPVDQKSILEKSLAAPSLKKRRFTVGAIGRHEWVKGFDRLLEAHRQLLAAGYDYELWLVGDGSFKEAHRDFIRENKLELRTTFIDFQENPYPYLKQMDLFVNCSRSEGLSTVTMEALILGKPVLATDCPGVSELLGTGQYGLVVENTTEALVQGLAKLLTDDEALTRYGDLAKKRGQDFILEAAMARLETFFLTPDPLAGRNHITVFTATFNRGHTLPKLYASLKKQRHPSFEWIVVDDGSQDQTFQLVSGWQQENTDFDIIYVRVKNGGKHRAINQGLKLAKGSLFFIVDSDDELTEDALENINRWEQTLDHGQRLSYAGIAGNKGYSKTDLVGTTFKGDFADGTSLERRKLNIKGDRAEVFYTHVLKSFPFPEFAGENFLTEAAVWLQIALAGHKIRWFNEIIYLCEYRDDGLTKNLDAILPKNQQGLAYFLSLEERAFTSYFRQERQEILAGCKKLAAANGLKDPDYLLCLGLTLFKDDEALFSYVYEHSWINQRQALTHLLLDCLAMSHSPAELEHWTALYLQDVQGTFSKGPWHSEAYGNYLTGLVHLKHGRLNQARDHFESCLALLGETDFKLPLGKRVKTSVREALGDVLLRQGHSAKALSAYYQGISLDPSQHDLLFKILASLDEQKLSDDEIREFMGRYFNVAAVGDQQIFAAWVEGYLRRRREGIFLSIIIPAYEGEEGLARCVASVLDQGFGPLEVILVNDGSTDGTARIMEEAAKSWQVRVIHQPNQGSLKARAAGLAAARGTYVFFLDADDQLLPKALEKLAAEAKKTSADLLNFDYVAVEPNGEEELIKHNEGIFSLWSKLIRRDFIRRLDEARLPATNFATDWLIHQLLLLMKPKTHYLPEPLYRYCRRPGSISLSFPDQRAEDIITNYQFMKEKLL